MQGVLIEGFKLFTDFLYHLNEWDQLYNDSGGQAGIICQVIQISVRGGPS